MNGIRPGHAASRQDGLARRKSGADPFARTVCALSDWRGVPVPADRFLPERDLKTEAKY